ncbi:hypothetical protein F5Y17DRAFT_62949 [Xylariaceae sp. FL0594]|nr:hypothetical protein F5Y17DRAFT_62949 [Xylariaceae sp. FL0594]
MDFMRIRTALPWRNEAEAQTENDLERQASPAASAIQATTDLEEETRNNLRLFSASTMTPRANGNMPPPPNRFSIRWSLATSLSRGFGRGGGHREPGAGHIHDEVVSSDDEDEDDADDDEEEDGPKPSRFRLPSFSRYSMRTRDVGDAVQRRQPQTQQPYEGHYEHEDPDLSPESHGQARGQTQEFYGQTHQHQEQGQEQEQQERRPRPLSQRFPILTRPLAVRTTNNRQGHSLPPQSSDSNSSGNARTRFNGSDPAELHLASLAETGRRRRERERRQRRGRNRNNRTAATTQEEGGRRARTNTNRRSKRRRFLFCIPWVKSRRARGLILRCFVSGVFLVSMLTVYLALAISKNINASEITIVLVIFILVAAGFFCHGLIALLMLRRKKKMMRQQRADLRQVTAVQQQQQRARARGVYEYAVPAQPIRVHLARDEEASGVESATAKMTPPAYGLWRESVRVDPNRIYWQRAEPSNTVSSTGQDNSNNNDENEDENDDGEARPRQQRRPPSYISDDGVDYVVDAVPRSVAPPPPSSVYSQSVYSHLRSNAHAPAIIGTPMTSVSYLMGEAQAERR